MRNHALPLECPILKTVTVTGLTDEAFWDEYWNSVRLPLQIDKSRGFLIARITDVLDRFLPRGESLSVLEVGGAPGQYAAYVCNALGHAVTVLDNSPLGCAKARENFDLLGMRADVIEGDLFQAPGELPPFDAVFSLGLIEHFPDVTGAVRAHLDLLKPAGMLLLGAPNLVGINRLLLRRLSPSFLSAHRPDATHLSTWDRFEEELGLARLFRKYLGGFDPAVFWRCESRRFSDRALHQALRYLGIGLEQPGLRVLRELNGPHWSAYLMGVYRAA